MKRLFVGVTLATVLASVAAADTAKTWLPKFETVDSLTRVMIFRDFDAQVPAPARAAALDAIWKAAGDRTDVRQSVMAYVLRASTAQLPMTPALEEDLLSAAESRDPEMRRVALHTLAARQDRPALRERIRAYLEDPRDDLREQAIIHLSRWREGREILQQYLRAHDRQPARERSVRKARQLLESSPPRPTP
jgi:hypothetical protein